MLNTSKRIEIIETLLNEDTDNSLTYAALECRLTLEYLCYERFKLSYSYLSTEDLKKWQPKYIVKQVSEEIDERISKGFTVSICKHAPGEKTPETKEDYESLEYTHLGEQSALNLNKLQRFLNTLSNVALHIPVPNITTGELNIYGNKDKIRKKVNEVLRFLSSLDGNLLMGGSLGKVYSFTCVSCESLIKKPTKYLDSPSIASCINPKCDESYLIEPDTHGKHSVTRRICRFSCKGCKNDLDVPTNIFKNLRFQHHLNICCDDCGAAMTIILHPLIKENSVL